MRKKNPHKETFCPQQHLFTQIEFQLWKKRQEQRFIGHVKQVKWFAPKYFFMYFYSVFSTLDVYFPGFHYRKPVPNITKSVPFPQTVWTETLKRDTCSAGGQVPREIIPVPRPLDSVATLGQLEKSPHVGDLQPTSRKLPCGDSQAWPLPCTHTRSAASQVLRC